MRGRGRGDVKDQFLIEEMDELVDADAEQLWVDEARRRYDAYLKGELAALPGDEVMDRARNALSRGSARP